MTAGTIDMVDINGAPVTLTEHQLGALCARLAGRVARLGDPGWPDATEVWTGRAAKIPALVLQVATPADVVAGIELAAVGNRDVRHVTGFAGAGTPDAAPDAYLRWARHRARLRRVTRTYDPQNLFRVNRNITPEG